MKNLATLLGCLYLTISANAQDYVRFSQTVNKLYQLKTTEQVDSAWSMLVDKEQIPFVVEDSVAFLYRGVASSVKWMGDFNGWGYNRKFQNVGKNIPGTDLWILKTSFPKDARLDYKILINDTNWILDPANPDHQWSGVGGGSPNSELRMPQWKQDALTMSLVQGAKQGKVERDILLNSKSLGYQITYSVYLPVSYTPTNSYPVVYVTDGYEYMHERLGNMITILDNLISLNKIEPVIAVFIDHREPVNRSNNRRMEELAMNQNYLDFLTVEMVPVIERNYSTQKEAGKRAVVGTSMGGLSAAFFAFKKPDLFGLAGIQSPAFWSKPEIYKVCDNPENPPVKIYMTSGTINDTSEAANRMKALLEKNTCTFQYQEVNQGHSWGNWRDTIDDILLYFFPKL